MLSELMQANVLSVRSTTTAMHGFLFENSVGVWVVDIRKGGRYSQTDVHKLGLGGEKTMLFIN